MNDLLVQIGTGASRRGTHRLSSFDHCPQAFAYRFLLKLQPRKEPRGRTLGTLVHLGLQHLYLARAGRPALDPIEAMRLSPARIAWQYETAREIVEEYIKHWAVEPFEVLDVEREYEIRAGGHLHTQRLDLVVAQQGKAVIYDHKTHGGDDSFSQPKEWETSRQFLSAEIVGRNVFPDLYGMPYGGIVINVIGTRQPHVFHRGKLQIRESLIRPAAIGLAETNDRIEAMIASGRDPWEYHKTWACQGRYGICDYWKLCTEGKTALADYVSTVDESTEVSR